MLHFTSARVDDGHYGGIVTVTQHIQPSSPAAPHGCPDNDWQELFDGDVYIVPAAGELQLDHSPEDKYVPQPQEPDASDVITTCGWPLIIHGMTYQVLPHSMHAGADRSERAALSLCTFSCAQLPDFFLLGIQFNPQEDET